MLDFLKQKAQNSAITYRNFRFFNARKRPQNRG
jgi:hypothetical protein